MDAASDVRRQMLPTKTVPSPDATRPGSGILTPSSAASLNHEMNGSGAALRKRKRDSSTMEDLLKPTIVVKVGFSTQARRALANATDRRILRSSSRNPSYSSL